MKKTLKLWRVMPIFFMKVTHERGIHGENSLRLSMVAVDNTVKGGDIHEN